MMNNIPLPTCDQLRQETLLTLEYLGPGLDAIVALDTYFNRIDDRTKTNNYCALIKRASKNCERFANPKLWLPLHSSTNVEHLIEVLDLGWPTKTVKSFRHIGEEFNDIDESFKRKGLRSTNIPGVNPYETKNSHPPQTSKQTSNKELNSDFQTAKEQHNPILDDPRLKNIDKNIAERIINEVVDNKQDTKWDDIAGLENVKQAINEIVVYPMQNPDLFQGLLSPAKGLLLFGPPGTGKTLIGKCIACESGATFFAISASSLTSKWVGEGEKMVRALFTVARIMQPSVVFIDEIDSLLTQRTDGEHDSTRRIKTEFLVQFDGVATGADDRLLVVGATNRPQELDEAARRRFTKRLYIPLPEDSARSQLIRNLMARGKSGLTEECIEYITKKSAGFSGADIATLCKEAALGSLRAVIRKKGSAKDLANDDIPPTCRQDFEAAFKHVKASVGGADLNIYEDWDKKFGASRESIEFDDDGDA